MALEVERQGIVDGYKEHIDSKGVSRGRTSVVDGALGKYKEHRDANGTLVGVSTMDVLDGVEMHRNLNGTIVGTSYNEAGNKITRDSSGRLQGLKHAEGGAEFAANEQISGEGLMGLYKKKEPEEKLDIKEYVPSSNNLSNELNLPLSQSLRMPKLDFNFGTDGASITENKGAGIWGGKKSVLSGGIFDGNRSVLSGGIFDGNDKFKPKKKSFLDGGIFG